MKSTSVIKNIKGKILGYFAKTKGDDYSTFFKTLFSEGFKIFNGSNTGYSIFANEKYSVICVDLSNNNNNFGINLHVPGITLTIQGLLIVRSNDFTITSMSNGNTFKFSDIKPDFVVGNTKIYLIKEPLIFTN